MTRLAKQSTDILIVASVSHPTVGGTKCGALAGVNEVPGDRIVR